MKPGHQHPQAAQDTEDKERVIEPYAAPWIYSHQNACSPERPFGGKRDARHRRITTVTVLLLAVLSIGCVADPRRVQSAELLDRLAEAHRLFTAQPPQAQAACDVVGDVQTRLNYEPGLSDIRPAWADLSQAAGALQAVCGQSTLLGLPAIDSDAVAKARQRWEQSLQREDDLACVRLRAAAVALDRPPPC